MIKSMHHVLLLSLCLATSYHVLALTPDNNNGEGRFPIQMPQIHPYRVSVNIYQHLIASDEYFLL